MGRPPALVEVSGPAPGNHCRLLLALGPRRRSRRGDAAVRVVRRLAGRPTTAIEMCYMSRGQRRERIPGRLGREIIIASIRRLIYGYLTLHSTASAEGRAGRGGMGRLARVGAGPGRSGVGRLARVEARGGAGPS